MENMKALPVIFSVIVLAMMASASGCADGPQESVRSNVQYLNGADELTFRKIGKEVADSVGALLKGKLMLAMEQGGPSNAVAFCNVNALPLTDSYSKKYDTTVKRTSDRLRNKKNAPNDIEAEIIAAYRAEQALSKPLLPKVAIDAQGRKVFYAPIFTAAPCLACHGNEANMDAELRAKLTELYPDDNAKGFNIDELRGIWSITFKTS